MIRWSERPSEIKNLLNPAFCARILYSSIVEYERRTGEPMPFVLIYLILPLVLHKRTREKINSRTAFTNWVQENQNLLISYPRRAKDLVVIANEAVQLLLQSNKVILVEGASIEANKAESKLSKTRFTDVEVSQCLKKAEHVARWFADTGRVETIYINLGVRP